MKRSFLSPHLIQALLPIMVVSLILFGWYMVHLQMRIIKQTTITAYQQTELELVRSMARSIDTYVSEQIDTYQRDDISAIEQEVLAKFIAPVRLLENGDAWIHTPDYVVFDLSADFPDEYRDQNIGKIFQIQRKHGASNYDQLVEGILQAEEGVGWYIWLAEKGEEIAAWTPITVNEYVWVVGISTPLSEIMEMTGASTQINLLVIAMSVVTLIVFGLLSIWGISVWNHKKVEKALQASEQKRRLHIEQTPMAMIECDHEGKILAWNQAAEQIFSYRAEEVMGQIAFHLLMPIENQESVRQIWQQVYSNDIYAMRSTNQNRTKEGKLITCDWYNTHLLDESGQTVGMTLMAADVTERIEREQQIREAKEEAENATRAKSDFLSNMSHELRTPLNGILGYAQVLRRKLGLESDVISGLEIIHQSGEHLLTLINDILDLSKIEARKMEIYPTTVELESFLRGVVNIMRMRAEVKDILFAFECDEALPQAVLADKTRLRQVLINLLSNAIKFTDHGQVLLRVKQLESATEAQNEASLAKLRFEVRDTGVGMSKAELNKIFLPFEQVGNNKRRAEGTGLGLAITRQLVKLMDGKIQVQSEVGQGTTFWVDLMLPVTKVSQKKESNALELISYEGQIKKISDKDTKKLAKMMVPPSQEILQQLHYAAQIWDLAEIQKWASEAKQEPLLSSFAERMEQLADEFEGEQIQTLIESYLQPNKNALPSMAS